MAIDEEVWKQEPPQRIVCPAISPSLDLLGHQQEGGIMEEV